MKLFKSFIKPKKNDGAGRVVAPGAQNSKSNSQSSSAQTQKPKEKKNKRVSFQIDLLENEDTSPTTLTNVDPLLFHRRPSAMRIALKNQNAALHEYFREAATMREMSGEATDTESESESDDDESESWETLEYFRNVQTTNIWFLSEYQELVALRNRSPSIISLGRQFKNMYSWAKSWDNNQLQNYFLESSILRKILVDESSIFSYSWETNLFSKMDAEKIFE